MWAKKPHSQTSTEIKLIMSRAEWEVGMVQNGWNCVFLLYLYSVFLEWRMLQTGGSCRLSSARRLAECSAIATDSWTASEWTHRQVALLNPPTPSRLNLCQKTIFSLSVPNIPSTFSLCGKILFVHCNISHLRLQVVTNNVWKWPSCRSSTSHCWYFGDYTKDQRAE